MAGIVLLFLILVGDIVTGAVSSHTTSTPATSVKIATVLNAPLISFSTADTTAFKATNMKGTGIQTTGFGELVIQGNVAVRNNVASTDGCNIRLLRNNTNIVPAQGADAFAGDTIVWRATNILEPIGGDVISVPVTARDSPLTIGQSYGYYFAIQEAGGLGTCTFVGNAQASGQAVFWDA